MFLTMPCVSLPFLQPAERLRLLRGLLDFDDGAAREHDVVPLLVERDDLELVLVPAQRVEVLDRLGVDQRAGQERLDAADVDGEPAFDAVDDAAADGLIGFERRFDAVPHQHALGFLAGQDDVAGGVFSRSMKTSISSPGLTLDLAVVAGDLVDGQESFGFVADVDHYFARSDLDDLPPDDVSLGEVAIFFS